MTQQPYAPSLHADVNTPNSSVEPYDYSAAIDPALETSGTSQMQVPPSSYDGMSGLRDSKGGMNNANPFSHAPSSPYPYIVTR